MADLNSRVDKMKVIGQDDKVMEVSTKTMLLAWQANLSSTPKVNHELNLYSLPTNSFI